LSKDKTEKLTCASCRNCDFEIIIFRGILIDVKINISSFERINYAELFMRQYTSRLV